jgi:ribulose-phosphate 3-epimerase
MHNNIQLSASLMCIDWLDAGRQLRALDHLVDYLHLDVIDGNFAPDFTMGSSIINMFRENSKLLSDYHLMVEEPSRLFDAFAISSGDIYTIHQECSRNLHRDLVNIRRRGAKVGVALSPGTPLEVLEYLIEDADVILLMTVDPGYKGQPLIPQTLRKVEKLKKIIRDMQLDIRISVDGCVNQETIPEMVSAGADILVLGSSGLFVKNQSLEESVEKIKLAIDKGIKPAVSAARFAMEVPA